MGADSNIPVILLAGPTASGKSSLAMAFAGEVDCEIISMDSAQVFRGMDIGTAKPSAAERSLVPHHLIDIIDPAATYSAARFCDDALSLISDIQGRGRIPLLVGGTFLYAKALTEGLSNLPPAEPAVRARISQQAVSRGWAAMHRQLQRVDPEIAARLHPNDAQRIQRALEIHAQTGKAPSSLQGSRAGGLAGSIHAFALEVPDRAVLHQQIEQRFHQMMAQGFLDEVRLLYARDDLHSALPSMRCVGYRQLWQHLAGDCDLDDAVFRGIVATRQLAKRQLTWMRGNVAFQALNADDSAGALASLKSVLTK